MTVKKVIAFHETPDGLDMLGTGVHDFVPDDDHEQYHEEEYTFPKNFFLGKPLTVTRLWSNFQGEREFTPTTVFYYTIPIDVVE